MLTTNQKGALAEAAVVKEAAKLGVHVSLPVADTRYDVILDVDGSLLRVQCKWAVRRGDVIVVTCRTNRRGRDGFIPRSYEDGEIDAIAAYCADVDQCYLLPLRMSVRRTAVQLRLSPSRNNQRVRINWARDFEFGAKLRELRGPIAQLGERVHGMHEAAGSSPAGSTF
jgi:nucleoid-associated protein YgaU